MTRKKKTPVGIMAAIIGGVALIVAAILPIFVQRWLDKPTEKNVLIDPITEYFPLYVGSTRTYIVGNSTPKTDGTGGLLEYISTYTEKVIFVESGSYENFHIYKVELTGEIYDLDCTGWSTIKGPIHKWYITFNNNLYVACSEDTKNSIIQLLYEEYLSPNNENMVAPKIVFPLLENNSWGEITQPREDNMYKYFVETKTTISTVAGTFEDCYKIVFYTLGDSSIRYVCPRIGYVALEYHHYGNPINYRVELQSFSLSGN